MEKTIQSRPLLVQGVAATIPGSLNLGTFATGVHVRINGLFSVTGSLTLRYSMGIDSGNMLVSSSIVINSGSSVVDVLNFGRYMNLTITAANSQVATYFVQGESFR